MRELIEELVASVESGRPVAFCRLVETRGSTPQKAGAAMLVYPTGQQSGTLGGGCVEAEVKRKALGVLEAGHGGEVLKFQLDSDYGWDDGLICGGRMLVHVEPLVARLPDYFYKLHRLLAAGEGCTEAIVFDADKSGLPAPAGYLFDSSGEVGATFGQAGGDGVATIARQLRPLAERPRPYAQQGVSYLPVLPRCRLVIVGGGHVGLALANLAADLEFDVCVVDDRSEYVSRERFPRAQRLVHGEMGRALDSLPIDGNTYCVIVTRGHNHDELALERLIGRGARYLGMIGSRRKIRLIFDDLEAAGVSRELLEQVYAPIGLEIGSQTVPEIAVSILAELIAHRNLGPEHLRPRSVAVVEEAD